MKGAAAKRLVVLAVAAGTIGLCALRSARAAQTQWMCDGTGGSSTPPSGALFFNGPTSTNSFLMSVFPFDVTLCSVTPVTTTCPVTGLNLAWSDSRGAGHILHLDNQYSFGLMASLSAGQKLNYSCSGATHPISAQYTIHQSGAIAENFGCGAQPEANTGKAGASGILFANGSGAPLTLILSIDGTSFGSPSSLISGLMIKWTDGSGTPRSLTLNGRSEGVQLTLGNGRNITYSCSVSAPISGVWTVAPVQ